MNDNGLTEPPLTAKDGSDDRLQRRDRPLHFETVVPVTRWSIFDMDRFVFRGSQSSPPNTEIQYIMVA